MAGDAGFSPVCGRGVCGQDRLIEDEDRSARTTRHKPAGELVHGVPSPLSAARCGREGWVQRADVPPHRDGSAPPAARDRRPSTSSTGSDPFGGLWEREIVPMLQGQPELRPIALLEEMERRHPDHDWGRFRRSLERRVRAWRAEHGADREVIFRQDHVPGRQALSDFTDMGDGSISIAGQPLSHRLYHFVLAYSAWEHAEPVLGGRASPRSPSACRTRCGRSAACRPSTAPTASPLLPQPRRRRPCRPDTPLSGAVRALRDGADPQQRRGGARERRHREPARSSQATSGLGLPRFRGHQ